MSNLTIYKYTNLINGKAYIGQTCDVRRREWFHVNTASCPAFNAAICKYGWENFSFETLAEGLTYENANDLEQKLIREHRTQVPYGYNLREGGNNSSPSPATREKMKVAATGRIKTEETRRKLSEAGKRLRSTPEYREAQRRRRLGTVHTEERKQRIRDARAKQVMMPRTDEQKLAASLLRRGVPRPTQQCPSCGIITSTTNIKRWHGDNCKTKGSDPTS